MLGARNAAGADAVLARQQEAEESSDWVATVFPVPSGQVDDGGHGWTIARFRVGMSFAPGAVRPWSTRRARVEVAFDILEPASTGLDARSQQHDCRDDHRTGDQEG